MESEISPAVDGDLQMSEIETLNKDVLNDVLREKKKNPPQFKSVWEEDQADEGTEEFDEETETDPGKRLLWEAEHGDLEAVKISVVKNPESVNYRDSDGYSPLHRASYNDHPQIVEVLIAAGADLGARTKEGWTPLHSASRWGHHRVVKLLLGAGADVNAQSTGKQAPLHVASVNREARKTVQLLLMHPDIDATLENGANETAATISRRTGGHFDLFECVEDCLRWVED